MNKNIDWRWMSHNCIFLPIFFPYHLGYLTNVTVIETEGVTDGVTPMWVESYYVSTSNNSETGSFVNYTEGGNIRIVSFFKIYFSLYFYALPSFPSYDERRKQDTLSFDALIHRHITSPTNIKPIFGKCGVAIEASLNR